MIKEVRDSLPGFMNLMDLGGGRFRYSLSGDILPRGLHWGLGNSVFALKIYWSLGRKKDKHIMMLCDYIRSFQRPDGYFFDPYVRLLSIPYRLAHGVLTLSASNMAYEKTMRAETRQAISSLALYGEKPIYEFADFPKTKEAINDYLNTLDWSKPWAAGSHLSHLLFFIKHSRFSDKKLLIISILDFLSGLQQNDGSWYRGSPSLQQKINGAMKVITALRVLGIPRFKKARNLVDLALSAVNDSQACDNFNVVYVLKYASLNAKGYRLDEIKSFVKSRLYLYKKYYYPFYGGFSFFPNKSNIFYYGAPLTIGKREPDIHGTVLFVWGLSIIKSILGIRVGLREFVT